MGETTQAREDGFRGTLVLRVTEARIEAVALALFVPLWGLCARAGRTRIVRWTEVREPPATYPEVTRVVVSGHGPTDAARVIGWDEGSPVLLPEDLARLCPHARGIAMWACYQGRQAEAWAGAFPEPRPTVRGHKGPVLGPFPVPEWLASAWGRLRGWLHV